MELLSSTVSLALLLLKPLRSWLSVAEALLPALLSWLPVVLRLACARPDAWLEMPPPRAEEAWPLPGTPSLRRRRGALSEARKCRSLLARKQRSRGNNQRFNLAGVNI